MILEITAFSIIVTHNIHSLRISSLIRHQHPGQRTRHRTRIISRPHGSRKPARNPAYTHGIRRGRPVTAINRLREIRTVAIQNRMRIRVIRIINLISYAPKEYAGVIPVSPDHIGNVPFTPFLKEIRGAVHGWPADIPTLYPFLLVELPFVKSLVHHEETHTVTEIVEHRRLRIMAGSYGIGTQLLKLLKTPDEKLLRDSRSKHSRIMMQTYALDLHPFAIQCEATVSIKLQRPQTRIDHTPVNQLLTTGQRDFEPVHITAIQIPEPCIPHFQRNLNLTFSLHLPGRYHLAAVIHQSRLHAATLLQRTVNLHIHHHGSHAVLDRQCPVTNSPLREMKLRSPCQPDISVYAGACIPP